MPRKKLITNTAATYAPQAQATVASYPQDLAALQASNASPDDLRRLHEKHREAQVLRETFRV